MNGTWRAGTNRIFFYKGGIPMITVGIDISKSKSTVAILSSDDSILAEPFTMMPNQSLLSESN